VNSSNASGGLAVSSRKPDPEPRGRREARFQFGQQAAVGEQPCVARSLRPGIGAARAADSLGGRLAVRPILDRGRTCRALGMERARRRQLV
jgi:hypothetical protein